MSKKNDKRFMLPHWSLFRFAWGIIVRITAAIKYTLMGPDKQAEVKVINSDPPKKEEKTTNKNSKTKAKPEKELSDEDQLKHILEKTNIVLQFKNLMSGIKGKEEKEADILRNKFFKYVQKNYKKDLNSLKELMFKKDKVELSDEEIEWSKVTSNITKATNEIEKVIQSGKELTDTEISKIIVAYLDLKDKGLKPEVLKELKLSNISPQKIEYRSYIDKKENLEKSIKVAKDRLERFNKYSGLEEDMTASYKEMVDALDAFVNKKDISYENAQKIWGKDCFNDTFNNIVKEQSKETHTEQKDDLHKGEDIKSEPKNGDLFIVNTRNRKQVYIYYKNKNDNVVSYISLKGNDIKKVPKYNSRRDKDKFLRNISRDILKTDEKKVSPLKPLNLNINDFSKNFSLEKMVGISSFEEKGKVEEQKQFKADINEIIQHYKIAVEVINKNKNIEEIDFNKIKNIESDIVQKSLSENSLVNKLNIATDNSKVFDAKIAELSEQLSNFEAQFGEDLNEISLSNHNGNIVIEYPSMNEQIKKVGALDENNKALYGISIKDYEAQASEIIMMYDSKNEAVERYETLKNEDTPTYNEALFKNAKISDYDRDSLINVAKSYIGSATVNETNKDTISEDKQIEYAHKAQNIANGLYNCVTEYKTCNRPEDSTLDDLYGITHSDSDYSDKMSDDLLQQNEMTPELLEYKKIEYDNSYMNEDGELIVDEEAIENECKSRGIDVESRDESFDQAQQSDYNPAFFTEGCHGDNEEIEEMGEIG